MVMRPNMRDMFAYSTLGIEFAVLFGAGVVLGRYADNRTGGGVLWTLVGAAAGFAAGMYRLVQAANQYRRQFERKDRRG